jgi:hypothetical protein
MQKFLTVPAVLGVCAIGLTACGGSAHSGATTTVTVPAAPAAQTQPAAPAQPARTPAPATTPAPAAAPATARTSAQIFHGSGQQDIGTITVPADSTLSWNCPSCGNTNFIINNANSDPNYITTNALDQTHGVDTLSAGVYHTVVVDTTGGPWTVAIGTTAPPPPSSSSAVARTSSPDLSSAATPANAQPSSSGQGSASQCDANISVSQGECRFAENTFYEYWVHQGAPTFSVYSSVDQTSFPVTCTAGSEISCTASQGTSVQFSQRSIDAYTQTEADSFASSHNKGS